MARQVGEQHGQWLESPENICGMETSELGPSEQQEAWIIEEALGMTLFTEVY